MLTESLRLIIWGIRKGLKRPILFCLVALFCLFSAGCYETQDEIIPASQAVHVEGFPQSYNDYAITAVAGNNDYRYLRPAVNIFSAESGYLRLAPLKDNVYIAQIKDDDYWSYMVMFMRISEGANGKELKMVFPRTEIDPLRYGVRLKIHNLFIVTLSGSSKNIMDFLKAHVNVDFTDEFSGVNIIKDKILKQAQVEGAKEKLVKLAREDLAKQLGVGKDKIIVKSVEKIIWPNSALGYPQEGRYYLQVLTDGYKIILGCDGKDYEYHTNMSNVKVDPEVKQASGK